MPITIIVGGQHGSEGKGKIAAYLSTQILHSVRTGGPNAGHTVIGDDEKKLIMRHIPCAVINPKAKVYLGAGSIIDTELLKKEIDIFDLDEKRLFIDPQAVVITDENILSEKQIVESISSTGKGVGAALIEKIKRENSIGLAKNSKDLKHFITKIAPKLHSALSNNQRILLEGTQGTALSIHHGDYPYVTSRDITAGSLCGEAGLGPTQVDRVIMVVRTFPIRVAGKSGPMYSETSWDKVTEISGYQNPLIERTTVTGKIRRVGEFDIESVVLAANLNGATEIALTFADYLDSNIRETKNLSNPVLKFISEIEAATRLPVKMVGTGPKTSDIIIL